MKKLARGARITHERYGTGTVIAYKSSEFVWIKWDDGQTFTTTARTCILVNK